MDCFALNFFDIVPVARDKVVEGLNEGVMVLDNLQRVVYCNTKMQEYLFPPGSDIIGKDFAELPAHFILIRKLLGKEEATSMEIELVLNRPSRITVEVTATRLSSVDRASAGTLLLFRDITERKKKRAGIGYGADQSGGKRSLKERIPGKYVARNPQSHERYYRVCRYPEKIMNCLKPSATSTLESLKTMLSSSWPSSTISLTYQRLKPDTKKSA